MRPEKNIPVKLIITTTSNRVSERVRKEKKGAFNAYKNLILFFFAVAAAPVNEHHLNGKI